MPISVACPTCGTKLKAPDNAVGKKVKCPKCASLVVVPAESDETASAISNAPAPAPKPKPRAEEPEEIEDIPEAGDEPPPDDEPDDDGRDDEAGDDEGGERKRKKKKKKGRGGSVSEDDKTWGMFAHLAGTLFTWLGALIVFMMKKDESAFLRHHTKESLNFQITMIIGWVVAVLLSCCVWLHRPNCAGAGFGRDRRPTREGLGRAAVDGVRASQCDLGSVASAEGQEWGMVQVSVRHPPD